MDFDGTQLKEEFNKAFGGYYRLNQQIKPEGNPLLIETLTLEQLWWLVKFAKHVRQRCRNNAAFNNYMNRNFAPARFSQVTKEGPRGSYEGLKITVGEQSSEGDNDN